LKHNAVYYTHAYYSKRERRTCKIVNKNNQHYLMISSSLVKEAVQLIKCISGAGLS